MEKLLLDTQRLLPEISEILPRFYRNQVSRHDYERKMVEYNQLIFNLYDRYGVKYVYHENLSQIHFIDGSPVCAQPERGNQSTFWCEKWQYKLSKTKEKIHNMKGMDKMTISEITKTRDMVDTTVIGAVGIISQNYAL